jgi:hypothetical protein
VAKDSGSLSIGERIDRLENEVDRNREETLTTQREVWEEMNSLRQHVTEIKIKAAESNVKLALIVGAVCTIGAGIVTALINWIAKGF